MKLRTKLKALAMPIAALALTTPIFTAASCGKQSNERYFFTVTNNTGLQVNFCDVGASIYDMKIGNTSLVYHPKDLSKFINHEGSCYFHGKLLGRVTGRFADGKVKGWDDLNLEINEKSATKNNCLHGGIHSLCYKDFSHKVDDTPEDYISVVFTYTSPDGEAGFPGKLDVTAEYRIHKNENTIDTILTAVPDKKTLINLSTHSLFRLGNDGDVLDYELSIPTAHRVEYEKEGIMKTNQVPKGTKLVTADSGIYNFNHKGTESDPGKKIGEDIYASALRDPVSNGYDHIWWFAPATTDRYVNLYNPKNKLNLKVSTTDTEINGFILYSNDWPLKDTIMTDGKQDTQYAGITIEPYRYFTADNLDPIIYGPGISGHETFRTSYTYEFTIGRPQ